MRYILVLSLFYNFIGHDVDGSQLLLRRPFQQVVDILSQFAFVQCAFHLVASFVDLVFYVTRGSLSPNFLPPGLCWGCHHPTISSGENTAQCSRIYPHLVRLCFPVLYGFFPCIQRNEWEDRCEKED